MTKEDSNAQFQHMLQRLFEAARQAKSTERNYDSRFNKEMARKAFVSRRPASTESDKRNDHYNSLQRQGSLYRKCVSLEQTSPSMDTQEQVRVLLRKIVELQERKRKPYYTVRRSGERTKTLMAASRAFNQSMIYTYQGIN